MVRRSPEKPGIYRPESITILAPQIRLERPHVGRRRGHSGGIQSLRASLPPFSDPPDPADERPRHPDRGPAPALPPRAAARRLLVVRLRPLGQPAVLRRLARRHRPGAG